MGPLVFYAMLFAFADPEVRCDLDLCWGREGKAIYVPMGPAACEALRLQNDWRWRHYHLFVARGADRLVHPVVECLASKTR